MRRIAFTLTVALGASACSSDTAGSGSPVTVRDSAGVRIVDNAAPASVDGVFAELAAEALLSIGEEEGDPNYQLHRVFDAHRFADGRTAIANSGTHQIRYYDASGRFVSVVGRQGSGPGEFSEISSINLYPHHDTLFAADDFRLHVFAPDGRFVETRMFDVTGEYSRPFMQGVFGDGSWLAMAFDGGGTLSGPPGAVIEASRLTLVRYDARGRVANVVTRAADRPRFVHQFGNSISYPYIPLTAPALHGLAGDWVFVVRNGKPEIEVYDATGRLLQVARWSRPTVRVADIWDTERSRTLAAMNEPQRARYEDFYSKQLPLPELVPSYSSMKVDDARRVWLQQYRLRGDADPPTWDVIAPDGTWLGSTTSVRGFTPYQIGDTFILGKHTDSLGVERVQLRALRAFRPR